MKSILGLPDGTPGSDGTAQERVPQGAFMLTLCELPGPVSIRPPESPHLKSFTFFASRSVQSDGSPKFNLHMGYFATLALAQQWAQRVRQRYPKAFVAEVPEGAPTTDSPVLTAEASAARFPPVKRDSLTETGVFKLLETRTVEPLQHAAADGSSAQIPMVRPEDTVTRRALTDAVVEGAPVSFSVQLEWSTFPIDTSPYVSLAMFKGHTLYVAQISREGRTHYFLRLGFFADPVSAKQVAFQARSRFASSVVIPVTEQEKLRVREPHVGDIVSTSTAPSKASGHATDAARKARTASRSKSSAAAGRTNARRGETLDETLEQLAEREMLHDRDAVSESGVRHLKVEIEK